MHPLFAYSRRLALLSLLLSGCGLAQAESVSGDCRYKEETSTIVDGLVFKQPNSFDKTKTDVVVALSTLALDKAALARISDGSMKESSLRRQLMGSREARLIKLTLEGTTVTALNYNGGGISYSTSGTGVGTLTPKASDASHVEASFVLEGDADELRCQLSFNLAYASTASLAAGGKAAGSAAAPAAGGKPLPPGGGEAGKVFQANLAAMQKGDIDAMLATVSKAQADKMRAQKNDPKFPMMLQMMKSFAPKSATVTGGQDFGDHAELTLDAVGQSGEKSSGTCKLVKEDGKWKVEKTSMKSGD
ncbi:uncharacterized protein DUF4878 [Tahibacter aquaticus]|uniref:Uncharacterized protein DUF4878 n=1 Tax=Tahibacter aquaticus TaxID=520092 RepID=A0A4R6Z824_9GAMM|nr:DUF4878 domain-containing protein [Tahibacter aquaticus]TDR47759.1 uncharacterized protein DUF4878 [Tahibacter aquaticus]